MTWNALEIKNHHLLCFCQKKRRRITWSWRNSPFKGIFSGNEIAFSQLKECGSTTVSPLTSSPIKLTGHWKVVTTSHLIEEEEVEETGIEMWAEAGLVTLLTETVVVMLRTIQTTITTTIIIMVPEKFDLLIKMPGDRGSPGEEESDTIEVQLDQLLTQTPNGLGLRFLTQRMERSSSWGLSMHLWTLLSLHSITMKRGQQRYSSSMAQALQKLFEVSVWE